MIIDSATGLVQWTPVLAQVGSHPVSVRVDDNIGAAAVQSYNITVLATNPPVFTTVNPATTATVGVEYSFDADANDPDGDPITFSLPTAPTDMSINPTTGLVTWIPTLAQLGLNSVELRVEDDKGGFSTISYGIYVTETPNNPPSITTAPASAFIVIGGTYAYDVDATDPDGDAITFSLNQGPTGMTIDPDTGLLEWTPGATQEGQFAVEIYATDSRGASAIQSYQITASTNHNPTILTPPPTSGAVGETYRYRVWAQDADFDSLSYALNIAPAGMTIDANGEINWTPTADQVAVHDVELSVTDGNGGETLQTYQITVYAGTKMGRKICR
jgi:hypothetical protein